MREKDHTMTEVMATNSPSSEGKNVILKVSENSDAQLEDLFKVLSAEGNNQHAKRSTLDGLPASIYKEPDRAEQQKNTLGPSVQLPTHGGGGGGYMLPSSRSAHSRVLSLPADLTRYPRDQHDFHNIPLPPGWEMGKTPDSHPYFIK